MDDRFLIVGLGNPGAQYSATRHNVGFMVIDELMKGFDSHLVKECCSQIMTLGLSSGKQVVLAKPQTYMNRSGEGVLSLMDEHRVPLSNLLIVLDDFYLPLGKLRFRSTGSAGGHNGLKSILSCLQDSGFCRLRMGIGQDGDFEPIDFVLGEFEKEERKLLEHTISRAAAAAMYFVEHGITNTMNKYN